MQYAETNLNKCVILLLTFYGLKLPTHLLPP
jgi:hypothetical protein